MADSLLQQMRNSVGDVYEKIDTVISDIPAEWRNQLNAFKTKANQFSSLYTTLQSKSATAAKNPALNQQYNALMMQGSVIQRTVMDLMTKMGAALSSINGMSGLGVLPLIPIAAVAAATYALTSWGNQAIVMIGQLDTVDKAIAAGADPNKIAAQASDNIQKQTTGSIFDQASGLIKWGIAGVALYLLFPHLKKLLRK